MQNEMIEVLFTSQSRVKTTSDAKKLVNQRLVKSLGYGVEFAIDRAFMRDSKPVVAVSLTGSDLADIDVVLFYAFPDEDHDKIDYQVLDEREF